MAYHFHTFNALYRLMEVEGHSEEELVVLAAVESRRDKVHAQLLGHDGSLIVDRYPVLIYTATGIALLAYMQQF